MKALSIGNCSRGNSLLEVLIAFALLTLSMSAVLVAVLGSQALVIDGHLASEALGYVQHNLEETRAHAQSNFLAIQSTTTTETRTGVVYTNTLLVADLTRCKKQATSTVSWLLGARSVRAELSTFLSDVQSATKLGGDCIADIPTGNWLTPKVFASSTMVGKPTAIDALNSTLYIGGTVAPYFFIANTTSTTSSFVTFANLFGLGAPTAALDAVLWRSGAVTKTYVYVLLNASSSQLAVVDVTNIYNPILVATRTLKNVDPLGSQPAGYKIMYYANRLYVLTKETKGPELHTFDVTHPTSPTELGAGIELGITANDFALQDQWVGGSVKRFLYLATSQVGAEVKVYDVTDAGGTGSAIEIVAARQDLPGSQNGMSVYVVGAKLYVGRASTPTGPDLYVYDTNDPTHGLAMLASQDIGTGVESILVAGHVAFLATPKSKKELQVWDIANPTPVLISTYAVSGLVVGGFDYDADVLYGTSQESGSLLVIESEI